MIDGRQDFWSDHVYFVNVWLTGLQILLRSALCLREEGGGMR